MTFSLYRKNGHFWTFLVKMLRMSQGKAKSHVSVYRWKQRWISFKLSPNNRNSGDHWKNVITGTLKQRRITVAICVFIKLMLIYISTQGTILIGRYSGRSLFFHTYDNHSDL
jgi:hypothetical protein